LSGRNTDRSAQRRIGPNHLPRHERTRGMREMGRKNRKKRNDPQSNAGAQRGLRVTRRLVGKPGRKAGSAPGTPVHTGAQRVEHARLHMIRYNRSQIEEKDIERAGECFPTPDPNLVTWLNIDGLHDTALLTELADNAELHPLVLEDVVSIGQRPKEEEYGRQHYIVLRMLELDRAKDQVLSEQISIVVGPNYVLSFQEAPGDVWDPVRERLRTGKGNIRGKGADYLAYALMDAIVDEYFKVVEILSDQLDKVEQDVMDNPDRETIGEIHHLKGELLVMRKAVWPLRDLFNSLIRDESERFSADTKVFLRDLYDHAFQIIDAVETMRDVTSGLIDLYLSSVSNRMNEVMKVLTIIGTVFIPLTFIVGVYGMNFDTFPELHWKYSYPVLWVIMLVVAFVMLRYFKRRHWL
jgi:magnesium transporter